MSEFWRTSLVLMQASQSEADAIETAKRNTTIVFIIKNTNYSAINPQNILDQLFKTTPLSF